MLIQASLLVVLLSAPAADAQGLTEAPLDLTVALVEDPDFPPLDEALVERALNAASAQFSLRFAVPAPRFHVRYRFDLERFMSLYAYPKDPACRGMLSARYKGGGAAELEPYKAANMKFFERWALPALLPFLPEEQRGPGASYARVYDFYTRHYPETVDKLSKLKTPAGTPLVSPKDSLSRSFVGWLCALKLQADYDVIITNTFILADLMSEPHPHSVLGKAKIGGIAVQSRGERGMDGQALLATTFAIDTPILTLSELNGQPADLDERADILGTYLLAHEIGHAVFGIPDAYDHPPGCLMTSRPGSSYREGLKELREHPEPCSKCQHWVEARRALDRGRALLREHKPKAALRELKKSIRQLPKHFHGSRRRRLAHASVLSAQAYQQLKRPKMACRYADVAYRLDPSLPASRAAHAACHPKPHKQTKPAETATTATTATTARSARR